MFSDIKRISISGKENSIALAENLRADGEEKFESRKK
jgi:hypothetical protein